MSLISVPGISFTQEKVNFTWQVNSIPVDPECIIHHRFPRVDDVVIYDTTDCVRVSDSATAKFTLDTSGVPTIIPDSVSPGYGVYECTIIFNGVSEVVAISHTESAIIEDLFSIGTRDSNGFTIKSPPADTTRLIYIDFTLGVNATQGPSGNNTDWYTGASPPTGGWENPSSVNAYKDIDTAITAGVLRSGQGDWLLLKTGETFTPANPISLPAGKNTSARTTVYPYGGGTTRPIVNSTKGPGFGIFDINQDSFIDILGIEITMTIRDPNHVDFVGWGSTDGPTAIDLDTGNGAGVEGFLFEDNLITWPDGGIGIYNAGGVTDCVIRRNIVANSYSEDSYAQGFSLGAGTSENDYSILIEDNVLDHNGWYKQTINVTGIATSGSTTSLTDVGAFTGLDFSNVRLLDDVGGGTTTIISNTDDVLTFNSAANVDFTSNTAYTIGGEQGQGQATIYNHNMYLKNLNNTIIRNNIVSDGSSGSIKTTSTKVGAEQHEMRDFIEFNNLSIYNEFGLGGGGNTEDSIETRFQDMRVMNNVELNKGQTDPTGRGVGWGMFATDWNRGIVGNNIAKDAGSVSPDVDNVYGVLVSRIVTDTVIAYNKIVDIGKSVGSNIGPQGCLLIDDDSTSANITGVQILNNDFQQQNVDGQVVADWLSAETSSITMSGNRYDASGGSANPYRIDGVAGSYVTYAAEVGETNPVNAATNYTDIGAGIANYQRQRGALPTIDGFISDAKSQSKNNYDPTLNAKSVNAYIRTALSDKPDIKFEVVQFLLSGDAIGATQTIPLSTGFGVPKGAILIRSGTWNGYPSTEGNANISFGFTDGTNMWGAWSMYDSEADPTQDVRRGQFDAAISNRRQSTSNQESYKIKASGGFITDNVVIEVVAADDDPSEHQYEAMMIVIGGDDVDQVSVFSHDDLGTGTSAVPIPVGFEPDIFIGATAHSSIINALDDNALALQNVDNTTSFGIAINDGNDSQRSVNWSAPEGVTPADSTSGLYNNALFAKMTLSAATVDYTVALSNFNSDGFDLTPSSSTGSMIFGGMAIKFKKRPKMALVDTVIPTSGNFSVTDIGFKPGFGFLVNQSGVTSMNTAQQVSQCIGFTPFDGSTTVSVNVNNEHGVTQDDIAAQASIAPELSLMVKGGSSALDMASTGDIFTNEGTDFITTANPPAAQVLGWMLALGVN